MADKPSVTYEVLALRYGIFDGRLQFQNYIIPDDHAAPIRSTSTSSRSAATAARS